MKIQHKLFLILFSFSLLLVTTLVLLMQWSIGKGMIDYVNTKEKDALQPVAIKLADQYSLNDSWRSMKGQHNKFRRLISEQLIDSGFSSEEQVRAYERPRPERGSFERGSSAPFSTEAGSKNLRSSPGMPPDHRDFRRPPPRHEINDQAGGNNERGFPKPPRPNENEAHYALLDSDSNLVAGKYLADIEYSKSKIIKNDTVIGYLAVSKRSQLTEGYEVAFIEEQQDYLWIIAVFSMFLVVLITLPLARHVVEPIKLITQGMHQLTQGDYKQSISLKRQDELGQLSRDYNELAHTLKENEAARKRWLANISHELRTPVAILRGELEAMLDQVRPLSLENIASANDEVMHLQRLIDDLNLLTSADIGGMRYSKQDEELTLILKEIAEKYHSYLHDANIKLNLDIAPDKMLVFIDQTRFCQLVENIMNNCVKYSSASQLNISVKIEKAEQQTNVAVITFEDNGVGVSDEHLPHLFEHLYRVDDSRNRKLGGSGLGLSICRHIVSAHDGDIYAQTSSLGGLAIAIKLPLIAC